MKAFITIITVFTFCMYKTVAQNRFNTPAQKPKLELGVDLRNEWFLTFPYFPTSRFIVGVNNGKNSFDVVLFNSLVSLKYFGGGLKYCRYKTLSKKYTLGYGGDASIMIGQFPYNEVDKYAGAYPTLDNKYCLMSNLNSELGYSINSKNILSLIVGLGGVYSFHKIPSSFPKENSRDQYFSFNYYISLSYRTLFIR